MSSKNRTSLVADAPITGVDTTFSLETSIWNGQQYAPLLKNGKYPRLWRLTAAGIMNSGSASPEEDADVTITLYKGPVSDGIGLGSFLIPKAAVAGSWSLSVILATRQIDDLPSSQLQTFGSLVAANGTVIPLLIARAAYDTSEDTYVSATASSLATGGDIYVAILALEALN